MKFKEVEFFRTRQRTSEIANLLEDFLGSGIKAAEITDYEDHYASISSLYTSLRGTIKTLYPDKVRCAKSGEHVYIERL